jgi:tetratricopeptide (TPR) repeat protein
MTQVSCRSRVRSERGISGSLDDLAGKYEVVAGSSKAKGRFLTGAAFLLFTALAVAQSEDLAEQSHRAKELMAQGHFEEAIPICEELVKALPGNPGLILNLGLAEEMAGHPAKAIPNFEAVLKVQPDSIPALTSIATARLQLHQPDLAVGPLKKLVTAQPENLNARGMLAGAEMGINAFEDAAEQYRQLTALDPSDAKAWYGLGKAYESLATASFHKLSDASPESPYVAVLIADSRVQRRQYRRAFFLYRQAEAKVADLPGLHAGLAKVYKSTGHADWAVDEERREQNLPAPACSVQTAECHFLRGEFLEAVQASRASSTPTALFWATRSYNQLAAQTFDRLQNLPESVESHAFKAQIFRDHGQHSDAANEWRAALKLDPGNPRLENELATSLFLGKDYPSATPIIEKLLVHQPQSAELNFMMGESLWRTQQPDKAIPYLEAALRAEHAMLPAHAALGMALSMLDRHKEAILHLQQALTLDDDGSLHYNLARAYQAAGNAQAAQQMMRQYQQIKDKNQEVDSELAKQAEITAPDTR